MGRNTHNVFRDCRPRLRYVHFPFDLIVSNDSKIISSFSRTAVVNYTRYIGAQIKLLLLKKRLLQALPLLNFNSNQSYFHIFRTICL